MTTPEEFVRRRSSVTVHGLLVLLSIAAACQSRPVSKSGELVGQIKISPYATTDEGYRCANLQGVARYLVFVLPPMMLESSGKALGEPHEGFRAELQFVLNESAAVIDVVIIDGQPERIGTALLAGIAAGSPYPRLPDPCLAGERIGMIFEWIDPNGDESPEPVVETDPI